MAKKSPQTKRRSREPVPHSVEVRMYNVGLGDSFLLSFFHSRDGSDDNLIAHRVLIDFGSVAWNSDRIRGPQIAKRILEDCERSLDAIVVTHRHRDHLSGFAGRSGQILIEGLKRPPSLILQPWTEDPDLTDDDLSLSASVESDSSATAARAFATREFMRLHAAQHLSASILKEVYQRREHRRRADPELRFWATKNLPVRAAGDARDGSIALPTYLESWESDDKLTNFDAVSNLVKWGGKPGVLHEYLEQGEETHLAGGVVPNLEVEVLGPAGPKDWKSIAAGSGAGRYSDELWAAMQAYRADHSDAEGNFRLMGFIKKDDALRGAAPIFDEAHEQTDLNPTQDNVRWIRSRADQVRAGQLLRFVHVLDNYLNNTSLVLLMRFGGFTMLFPGDAEIASWQQILENDGTRSRGSGKRPLAERLADVDLYKVGHHASNNATPIESLWQHLHGSTRSRPLTCLVSSQPTKYDGIPAPGLVRELNRRRTPDGERHPCEVVTTIPLELDDRLVFPTGSTDDRWTRCVDRGRPNETDEVVSLARTFRVRPGAT